jgi:hypothetical protein
MNSDVPRSEKVLQQAVDESPGAALPNSYINSYCKNVDHDAVLPIVSVKRTSPGRLEKSILPRAASNTPGALSCCATPQS